VASAVATGEITILSDGTPWRPLIHVRDMARAIEWAISRPATTGGQFLAINTGSDSWNYRVKELAAAVAEALPGTQVHINPAAAPDLRSYRVDFSLYRQLAPDHQPQYGLKEAIEELHKQLLAMNFRDSQFRSSQWMRLRVLAALREQGQLTAELTWADGVGVETAAVV